MADAAYHRAYRQRIKSDPKRREHYRAVSRARKQRLRSIPGWRQLHEPKKRVISEPMPELHTGHPLFDEARANVKRSSNLTSLHDPLFEDLRSEYVLALLEGRDPFEAVRRYRNREWNYGRRIVPLFVEN